MILSRMALVPSLKLLLVVYLLTFALHGFSTLAFHIAASESFSLKDVGNILFFSGLIVLPYGLPGFGFTILSFLVLGLMGCLSIKEPLPFEYWLTRFIPPGFIGGLISFAFVNWPFFTGFSWFSLGYHFVVFIIPGIVTALLGARFWATLSLDFQSQDKKWTNLD